MFVAIRDLRCAKGRFALMGTVVTLITLLVVLLSGLTAGLGRGNTSAVTDLPADHLVFSAPASEAKLAFTDSSITPSVQAGWSRVAGVQQAEPVTVAMTRAGVSGRTAGVALFTVPAGSPLAPGVGADQVVLSTKAADALDVAAGERIDVAGQSVTIAAVSGDDEFSHAPVIWAATTTVPLSGQKPGNATFLALTTDGSTFDSAAMDTADQRLGTTTLTPAQSLSAIGSYTSENGSLQLMRALLFAISALSSAPSSPSGPCNAAARSPSSRPSARPPATFSKTPSARHWPCSPSAPSSAPPWLPASEPASPPSPVQPCRSCSTCPPCCCPQS